jgi:hypothetical protein
MKMRNGVQNVLNKAHDLSYISIQDLLDCLLCKVKCQLVQHFCAAVRK